MDAKLAKETVPSQTTTNRPTDFNPSAIISATLKRAQIQAKGGGGGGVTGGGSCGGAGLRGSAGGIAGGSGKNANSKCIESVENCGGASKVGKDVVGASTEGSSVGNKSVGSKTSFGGATVNGSNETGSRSSGKSDAGFEMRNGGAGIETELVIVNKTNGGKQSGVRSIVEPGKSDVNDIYSQASDTQKLASFVEPHRININTEINNINVNNGDDFLHRDNTYDDDLLVRSQVSHVYNVNNDVNSDYQRLNHDIINEGAINNSGCSSSSNNINNNNHSDNSSAGVVVVGGDHGLMPTRKNKAHQQGNEFQYGSGAESRPRATRPSTGHPLQHLQRHQLSQPRQHQGRQQLHSDSHRHSLPPAHSRLLNNSVSFENRREEQRQSLVTKNAVGPKTTTTATATTGRQDANVSGGIFGMRDGSLGGRGGGLTNSISALQTAGGSRGTSGQERGRVASGAGSARGGAAAAGGRGNCGSGGSGGGYVRSGGGREMEDIRSRKRQLLAQMLAEERSGVCYAGNPLVRSVASQPRDFTSAAQQRVANIVGGALGGMSRGSVRRPLPCAERIDETQLLHSEPNIDTKPFADVTTTCTPLPLETWEASGSSVETLYQSNQVPHPAEPSSLNESNESVTPADIGVNDLDAEFHLPRMLRQMADEVDVFLMSAKEQQQMAKLQMSQHPEAEQMGKLQMMDKQMADQQIGEERQMIEKPGMTPNLSEKESRYSEIPESGEDLKSFEGEEEGLAAEAMIAVERLDHLEEADPAIAAEMLNFSVEAEAVEKLAAEGSQVTEVNIDLKNTDRKRRMATKEEDAMQMMEAAPVVELEEAMEPTKSQPRAEDQDLSQQQQQQQQQPKIKNPRRRDLTADELTEELKDKIIVRMPASLKTSSSSSSSSSSAGYNFSTGSDVIRRHVEEGAVCPTMKASVVRKMAQATVNMNEDGGYQREMEVEGKGLGGIVEVESGRKRKDIKTEEKMIIESEESIPENTSDQMRLIDQSTNALRIDESANVWRILLHQLSNSKTRSQGSVETGKRRVSGDSARDVIGGNGSGDGNEGSLWLKMIKNLTNADGSWNANNLDANNVMANINANANTMNNANVNAIKCGEATAAAAAEWEAGNLWLLMAKNVFGFGGKK